jgi:hypothetical protein
MSWMKRLGRSDAVRAALCRAIALYIRAIWRTNRWHREGYELPEPFHAARKPYIGAFWHGRLLMMPYGWPRILPLAMLISPHGDGRIIADAVNRLGIDIIPGSSNRGAGAALRALVRTLQQGSCVAITPDGPDGPAMAATAGVIQVARLSGAPIFPITYATSRRRILESWDRFHLPLPFGRGIFLVDPPIAVPADADDAQLESLRRLLEGRLRAITAEADRRMGHGAVAPGTLSRDAFRARRRAAAGPAGSR